MIPLELAGPLCRLLPACLVADATSPLTPSSLPLSGRSGSGKSTVACTLEHALAAEGHLTALLDGDNIRHGLNNNLGFTPADRVENIRRIGEVSKLFADTGVLTLVSFISPYLADRDKVRSRLKPSQFIEVRRN